MLRLIAVVLQVEEDAFNEKRWFAKSLLDDSREFHVSALASARFMGCC